MNSPATSNRLPAIAALTFWLLLPGCPEGGREKTEIVDDRLPDSRAETVVEVATCSRFKLVGQPCDDECECLGGQCLLNEYAPFRFCSKKCGSAQPGTPCEPDVEGAPWNSMCLEFGSEWLVPPDRFCAPLCSDPLDCDKLGAPWESCEAPAWKGNPLYSALSDKVCISPSAQGHEPVDPDTCEGWEEIFNEFSYERLACIGFCEFLQACQEMPDELSTTCCGFACTSKMIASGVVDKAYFNNIKCYFEHYQQFSGTALVCTKPFEVCGDDPVLPTD